MINVDFVQALADIQREKDIPRKLLAEIIEQAIESAYKKHFGTASDIHVEIDWEEARATVFSRKLVVEQVEDPQIEMTLEDARRLDPTVQIGDRLDLEISPEELGLGRIAAQTAKQVVVQKIREAERQIIFDEFSERSGQVITGQVSRREGRLVLINLGKVEALLPASEQMHLDGYRFGERIKIYVVEVKQTTKTPHVLVSRTHPGLLRGLFELEVPEIHEGVVEIKSVAREAGFRSKVAVASRQENVDPVGACVGHRGSRVQAVVDEMRGEKIDIVRWSDDSAKYLASSLSPAKVASVKIDSDQKSATVIVPDNMLSLAIGKEGQNVRLAARLTGWRIDIRSESQVRERQMEETAKAREEARAAQAEEARAAEAEEAQAAEAEEVQAVEAEAGAGKPQAEADEPQPAEMAEVGEQV